MPVSRICLVCQRAFSVKLHITQRGQGKYCSQSCYHQRPRLSTVDRFWSFILKTETCWLWQRGENGSGYGLFSLSKHEQVYAHRFAYELAYGLILPGLCVCHHCDNPPCCRPEHLFLGTKGDNLRDMVRKQRHGWRTQPERAKLTEVQVREMRRLHAQEPVPYAVLARAFGISKSMVSRVILRQNWQHVPDAP